MLDKEISVQPRAPNLVGSKRHCEYRDICLDIASGNACRGPCDLQDHFSQTIINQMQETKYPVLMSPSPASKGANT